MNLTKISWGLLGLGVLVTLAAFMQDTAPEGTHNLGLLQSQMMWLQTGLALALGGGVAGSIGAALRRMEDAGILPVVGVRPTLGTSRKAGDS